jgi:hypothetical protein
MSELLTVRDVAVVLKCGEDAVVRRFAKIGTLAISPHCLLRSVADVCKPSRK